MITHQGLFARRPTWFVVIRGRRFPHPLVAGGIALWLVLNVWGSWVIIQGPQWATGPDWTQYVSAARRLTAGAPLYVDDALWRYSPIAAWIMVLLAPLGLGGWRWLHLAALLAMRDWRMSALTLTTWPFWVDLAAGNTVVFVLTAGVHALRGSRIGAITYLALFLMIPRPIQLPLAAWLVWKRPELRLPAIALFAAHTVLVAISGEGPAWISYLFKHAGEDAGAIAVNVHPLPQFGFVWLAIGLPLAIFFTWKGRVGLASLAISPWWLVQYLLVLLWDVCRVPVAKPIRREQRSA